MRGVPEGLTVIDRWVATGTGSRGGGGWGEGGREGGEQTPARSKAYSLSINYINAC